jgi:hypothetical protein
MLRRTRLLALAGLVLIALLYWKPLRTYQHTRTVLDRRQAEVARLRVQQQQLRHRQLLGLSLPLPCISLDGTHSYYVTHLWQ